ncbi:sensor histidine kinase [Bacillaceae bacterium W0354]
MKLKNKLFLSTSFLFILIMTIVSITIYFTFSNITYDREIERVEATGQNVVNSIQGAGNQFPIQDLLHVSVPTNGMIRIVTSESILAMAVSGERAELADLSIDFQAGKQMEVIELNNEKFGFVQFPMIWHNGQVSYFQFIESFESVQNNLDILALVLIIVTVIAIIPIVISGRVLSDVIIRPIHSLIETMNEIRSRNTFKHIPLEKQSNDELYTMSQTFNAMIDLLKENYERQEAFVSNASHELRTPLTVIESYSNLLKRRGLERPEVVMESIEAIHSEALRMKDLTEQLLLLARRDKDWVLTIEEVSLQKLLTQIATYIERAYKRQVELTVENDVIISTDEKKLHQLLYIFIDNARKYSQDLIELKLFQHDSSAVIVIRDWGIGIPEEAMDQIFDRFYRVDEARTREEGGSGLGLALAKEIAEALHIDIDVQSELNKGTTIILTVNSLSSH